MAQALANKQRPACSASGQAVNAGLPETGRETPQPPPSHQQQETIKQLYPWPDGALSLRPHHSDNIDADPQLNTWPCILSFSFRFIQA